MDNLFILNPELQHRQANHSVSFSGCGGWKCDTCHSSASLIETPLDIANRLAAKWNVDDVRKSKALDIYQRNHIERLPNGNYQIASQDDPNHFYQVNHREHTCNCIDYGKNHSTGQLFTCKHILAVAIYLEQTNWKVRI